MTRDWWRIMPMWRRVLLVVGWFALTIASVVLLIYTTYQIVEISK